MYLAAAHDHRAVGAAGERGDLAVPAHAGEGGVEAVDLVERADLRLVGEQDVHVVLDEVEEGLAVPTHAERIRQREGDLAAGGVGDGRGRPEGLLGLGRIEEIALEIEDPAAGEKASADAGGA